MLFTLTNSYYSKRSLAGETWFSPERVVYRREIRVITKLIGIVYFYLYLRRRRIKIDSNRGQNIKYLIIMFTMELNFGKRIYSIDGKVTKNIPPPKIIKIAA